MLQEFKEIKSAPRDIRSFSYVISGVLILWLFFEFWKTKTFFFPLFSIAVIVLFLGITFPKILKPFYLVWMGLGVILGWFMTRLILFAVFFLILTPLAFLKKKFEKKSSFPKPDPAARSYWIKREQKLTEGRSGLEKQF